MANGRLRPTVVVSLALLVGTVFGCGEDRVLHELDRTQVRSIDVAFANQQPDLFPAVVQMAVASGHRWIALKYVQTGGGESYVIMNLESEQEHVVLGWGKSSVFSVHEGAALAVVPFLKGSRSGFLLDMDTREKRGELPIGHASRFNETKGLVVVRPNGNVALLNDVTEGVAWELKAEDHGLVDIRAVAANDRLVVAGTPKTEGLLIAEGRVQLWSLPGLEKVARMPGTNMVRSGPVVLGDAVAYELGGARWAVASLESGDTLCLLDSVWKICGGTRYVQATGCFLWGRKDKNSHIELRATDPQTEELIAGRAVGRSERLASFQVSPIGDQWFAFSIRGTREGFVLTPFSLPDLERGESVAIASRGPPPLIQGEYVVWTEFDRLSISRIPVKGFKE